jgi:hypothetical protein
LFYCIKNHGLKYNNYSFSQEGEDIIIDVLLNYKEKGFYVDFGALHPMRFSNTMHFYSRGWNGVNVDAMPGSMQLFDKIRPRDINVEAGIYGEGGQELIFWKFEEPALSTFDAEAAERLIKSGWKLLDKILINTYSPMQILDKYVGANQEIDFIDIDIEGFDEQIINSIDWKKYRPIIVSTEKKYSDKIEPNQILIDNGYNMVAFTGRTAIYKLKNS